MNNNSLIDTINAQELKIDEGYKNLIRPLSEQEFSQLEENILQNDILNPVIVTEDNTIIDGHHRHQIALKHNLPIPIKTMNFNSRADIELWIIKNQFSRRNLSKYERGILALKLKPIIAASAKKNQGTRTDLSSVKNLTNVDTKKEVAKIAGISHGTLAKIEKINNEATDEMKQLILNRQLSIDKAYKQIRDSVDPKFSFELNDNPFSEEEVKLLDEIEKSAVNYVLFMRTTKYIDAQKAHMHLEKCKKNLNILAKKMKKVGNKKHSNLLIQEIEARSKRGNNFGMIHAEEAGEYIRGEKQYEPLGNKSIIFSEKLSKITIEDYKNLIINIRLIENASKIHSLIDEFVDKLYLF